MLQFLTHRSDRFSIAEETQMALEGGCRWIQVTKSTDEGKSVKETVAELLQMCEENEAFLIVDDDIELCKELRIHGVHLSKGGVSPAAAREELGPHAVIGVDATCADDIIGLKGLDIDYAVLEPFGKLTVDDYRNIIEKVKDAGVEIHIVARGEINIDDIADIRDAGINGVAMWQPIIEAADPPKTTSEIIAALQK